MEFYFIIVEPETPENVGAAARALNTMGFKNLRLVKSDMHDNHRARYMAHGSAHILEQVKVFDSLEFAVEDTDYVIGTVPDKRKIYRKHLHLKDCVAHLATMHKAMGRVAVVFGRESIGLTNDELKLCDLVSTIPMAQSYPSLNLAQSVMVFAYELAQFNHLEKTESQNEDLPLQDDYRMLKERVMNLLRAANIPEANRFHQKLLSRIGVMSKDNLSLTHYVCHVIETLLKRESHENRCHDHILTL